MAKYACSPTEDHTWAYVRVLAKTHLPPKDRTILNDAGPGNSRLRSDHHIAAQDTVVCNMNEVIYLRSSANARFAKRPTVDSGVGSDLNVVFNYKSSLLRKGNVFAGCGVARIAEAGGSEYSTGLDDNSIPKACVRINCYICKDVAIISYNNPVSEHGVRSNTRAATKLNTFAENGRGMNTGS